MKISNSVADFVLEYSVSVYLLLGVQAALFYILFGFMGSLPYVNIIGLVMFLFALLQAILCVSPTRRFVVEFRDNAPCRISIKKTSYVGYYSDVVIDVSMFEGVSVNRSRNSLIGRLFGFGFNVNYVSLGMSPPHIEAPLSFGLSGRLSYEMAAEIADGINERIVASMKV